MNINDIGKVIYSYLNEIIISVLIIQITIKRIIRKVKGKKMIDYKLTEEEAKIIEDLRVKKLQKQKEEDLTQEKITIGQIAGRLKPEIIETFTTVLKWLRYIELSETYKESKEEIPKELQELINEKDSINYNVGIKEKIK